MGKIIGFLIAWISKKFGGKVVLIIITSFYWAFVVAYMSFVISSLITIYNLIHNLLNYLSSTPSVTGYGDFPNIFQKFLGLLDLIGFTQAFEANMPLITSALAFYILRSLYVTTNKIYRDSLRSASNLYLGL